MVKEQKKELLCLLGFKQQGNTYTKHYKTALHPLLVDVEKGCIYYENSGIMVTRNTTSNFNDDENLVVLECVTAIEKEKVYYFVLAHMVTQPVLLIKSPASTADIKKFLGYGWSGSKGNEGIQYLNVAKAQAADEEEDGEEDDDTMEQIRGINKIQTPLFNPANLADENKINTLIRKNFLGENVMIPAELAPYVTKGRLVDMLDFSRTSFTKEFRTSVASVEQFETKYPLVKMGSLIVGNPQYGANEKAIEGNPQTDYRYIRITDINEDGTLNDDWKTAATVEQQYVLEESNASSMKQAILDKYLK